MGRLIRNIKKPGSLGLPSIREEVERVVGDRIGGEEPAVLVAPPGAIFGQTCHHARLP